MLEPIFFWESNAYSIFWSNPLPSLSLQIPSLSPTPLLFPPYFMSSFLKNLRNPLSAASICMGLGTAIWVYVASQGHISDFPSPCSHKLPVASQLGMGLHNYLPPMLAFLFALILCRSCTCIHGQKTVSLQAPITTDSLNLSSFHD